ncbi:MAG: M18 family aminopeptidase [Halanaerobiales bacterium]
MGKNEKIQELLDFIYQSPTSFHAVVESASILKDNGFQELDISESWLLELNSKYYITINNSALIAFKTGSGSISENGFRIIGSHVDSPGFRIKPDPEMVESGRYLKLNTEVYGGPILNTWLDRPLSLAGRLSCKSDNPLKPVTELVNINNAILTIPNLAIHLNSDVNKGVELNKQKDILPLLAMIEEDFKKDNFLLKLLAENTGINPEKILDFDLYLYEYEKGKVIGLNNEFISSSRLDDLSMVRASLESLIQAGENKSTRVAVLFDNEEIGSRTKQGADSPILANALERIAYKLGYTSEDYYRALANSFIISADMAHAVHPNFPEKHDPTNKNYLNNGPVIKISANQKYTSDSDSIVVIKELCRGGDIPFQSFVNRSDQKGGSTIGPVTSSQLPIRSVDIGNPLLAMHSIRELAGTEDYLNIIKLFDRFYNVEV